MRKNRTVMQSLIMVAQFGISMFVPIFLCTLLGAWLGKRLDMPILTVPLFFMGALAGGQNVYRMSKKLYVKEDKAAEDEKLLSNGNVSEDEKLGTGKADGAFQKGGEDL